MGHSSVRFEKTEVGNRYNQELIGLLKWIGHILCQPQNIPARKILSTIPVEDKRPGCPNLIAQAIYFKKYLSNKIVKITVF